MLLPALALAAPGGTPAVINQAPDYTDWYQVEIIVFAQRKSPPGDEIWPAETLSYPKGMLAIGPASDEDIQPDNLAELRQLVSTRLPESEDTTETVQPEARFLFQNKSLHRQDATPEADTSSKEESPDAATEQMEAARILGAKLPEAFRSVAKDDMNLNNIAGSIHRSSLYTLLLHEAWRQPVVADTNADPILIQTGKRYGDAFEVDGTLTVSRSRFLHVDTDLWFTQFVEKYDEELPLPESIASMDPATLRQYPALVNAEKLRNNYVKVQSHRMKLSRRMRSSTLHYLDNPFFGVLVEITPFSYTPPAAAE